MELHICTDCEGRFRTLPGLKGHQTRKSHEGYVLEVSDPAPTVDAMDDGGAPVNDSAAAELDESDLDDECEHPMGFTEHGCPCGASAPDTDDETVPAEHQPGRPPAAAEVSYWQQQAREAAGRHMVLALAEPNGDAAELAVLKEQEDAFTGPAEPVPAALPTPDQFMDPAEPEVELNVSGQPPARRDYLKRYIVIDPDLGDFRRTKKERKPFGITRATTFNKHAQNTIALNGWSKRNVVMGASLRPDILRRAHGLHHDKSKEERETLDRIVDELETAAGAKVAADEGTFLHGFCDQVDAGLKTWQDAPKAYQQDIKRYVEALEAKGLEPVPGLIERTTFIREYGGVAGTFDRIFYHRPSGQYIVGDLKTGKTMKYALDETECQIWTYAHGVNQTGIYDWNTDTWERAWPDMTDRDPDEYSPITVSETVGVIVHMPVQGPEAGEVYLRFADLERGRAYAELNNAVKSYEKSKVRPFEMPAAVVQGEPWHDAGGGVEVRHSVVEVPDRPRERNWHAEFKAVTSRDQANALYRELKAHGANEEYLALALLFGKQALSRVDTSS